MQKAQSANWLDWGFGFLAVTSVVALFFPGQITAGASLLLFLLILIRDPRFIGRILASIYLPLLLVLLFFALSATISIHSGRTLKGGYDFLRAVFMMIGVLWLLKLDESQLKSVINVSVLSIFLVTLASVIYLFTTVPEFQVWKLSYTLGWSFSQNIVATECGLLLLLSAFGVSLARTQVERWVLGLSVLFFLWMVWETGSRGTILAIGFVALYMLARRLPRRQRYWLLLPVVVVCAGFASLSLETVKQLFPFLYHGNELEFFFTGQGGDRGRIPIYLDSLKALQDSWLTGYGINTFKFYDFSHGYTHPHSIYLDLMISAGLFGVVFVASLVWMTFSLKKVLTISATWSVNWSEAGAVLLVYSLARGLFDHQLFDFSFLSMILVALSFTAASTSARKPEGSHSL
jgi:O-antigen ligase